MLFLINKIANTTSNEYLLKNIDFHRKVMKIEKIMYTSMRKNKHFIRNMQN